MRSCEYCHNDIIVFENDEDDEKRIDTCLGSFHKKCLKKFIKEIYSEIGLEMVMQ